MWAAVASLPTGPTGVVFLPFLSGRQAPAPDSSARLCIYDPGGATVSIQAALAGDVALFTKAMYEGVSLQARWMETEQRWLAGLAPAEQMVVLAGSAARRGPWLAIKNAVTPQRLSAVAAQEPVASGATLLAACRVGLLDAEQAVLRTDPWGAQPTSAGEDRYQDMFHSFRTAALAPSLDRPLGRTLSVLSSGHMSATRFTGSSATSNVATTSLGRPRLAGSAAVLVVRRHGFLASIW